MLIICIPIVHKVRVTSLAGYYNRSKTIFFKKINTNKALETKHIGEVDSTGLTGREAAYFTL